ncbi:MAG: hypothetical protein HOK84_10350 [Bacteroidetes bacterium]|nr:hypothetical protein [Bacteroidota bacterium]
MLLTLVMIFIFANTGWGQVSMSQRIRKITATPEEYISFRNSLTYNDAIEELSSLSKQHLNKLIVNPIIYDGPIGIDINNIYWFEALEMILTHNDLTYKEYGDHIIINRAEKGSVDNKLLSAKRFYESREVIISTVFFEADRNKMRQLGMSWGVLKENQEEFTDLITGERGLETVFRRGLEQSSADNKTGLLNFEFLERFDFGDVSAIFKTLDNFQMGEILASPQITVLSENEGEIQIGSDFSVTVQDFAGNTVTQFFSTGSILKVTPQVITVDSVTFIHIELDAEKSSATSSELGIEIKKASAITSILLLNGEETVIGGLYTNDQRDIREGIPFLKDLPWWFFGLRYIFGYESVNTIQKELIILLKVDLVPSLAERIQMRLEENNQLEDGLIKLNKQRDRYLEQIDNLKPDPEEK